MRYDEAAGTRSGATGGDGCSSLRRNRLVAPKPPTPPPGVFCTTPLLTPRMAGSRLGAPDVGIGDVQVVAGNGDVEIVFERKRDGIIHGDA